MKNKIQKWSFLFPSIVIICFVMISIMRTIPARALQYIADISDRKTVHSQQPYYSEDEATENETIENDIVQTVTTLKNGTEKTAESDEVQDIKTAISDLGQKTNNSQADDNLKNNLPADGVFQGSALCDRFNYSISIYVRFKGGRAVSISKLKISGNDDPANEAFMNNAWKTMSVRILKAGNSDVDIVTGATYSSDAIKVAYQSAYAKAVAANNKNSNSKVPDKTISVSDKKDASNKKYTSDKKDISNKKDASDKKDNSNKDDSSDKNSISDNTSFDNLNDTSYIETIKDGTYKAGAMCKPDSDGQFNEYMLYADVTFKNGYVTGISGFSSEDESNKPYYTKAAKGNKKYKGVVEQIISQNGAKDIQAVSGATCSSKSFVEIYKYALKMATVRVPVSSVQARPGDNSLPEESVPPASTSIPMPEETMLPWQGNSPYPKESAEPWPDNSPYPKESAEPLPDNSPYPKESAEPWPDNSPYPKESAEPWPDNSPYPKESAEPLPGNSPSMKKTYNITVSVMPDEDREFRRYAMSADVSFEGKNFSGFDNIVITDVANEPYMRLALNGTKNEPGILAGLLQKNDDSVDVVSGATCSSNAFLEMYKKACMERDKQ